MRYVPGLIGSRAISIKLGTKDIYGSPFHVDVVAGDTCAQMCLAHGAGLTSAMLFEEAKFTIQAQDEFGNNKAIGGDLFHVAISPRHHGHYGQVLEIEDNSNGTYLVTYVVSISGRYSIAVLLEKEPISNSPFFVMVENATTTLRGPPSPHSLRHRSHQGRELKHSSILAHASNADEQQELNEAMSQMQVQIPKNPPSNSQASKATRLQSRSKAQPPRDESSNLLKQSSVWRNSLRA